MQTLQVRIPDMVTLCEYKSERPYLFQFEPYLGKKLTKISPHGLYFDVVSRLTHSVHGSNARIFTDSLYSSCKLFLFFVQT